MAYLLLGNPYAIRLIRTSGTPGNMCRLPLATEDTIGATYAGHASVSSNNPGRGA
jgi:hypothetical protein